MVCLAGRVAAQEQGPAASCPQVHVVDCPEATITLASLVEAECLATPGDAVDEHVVVQVVEGTCDVPVRLSTRIGGQDSEWDVDERSAHWRFVALAIVETLRPREESGSAPPLAAEVDELPPVPELWVDPRPVATPAQREQWLPHYAGLDDTGRGTTSLVLRLGVAGAEGIVGLGSLSVRHRFHAPWTLGIEAHPVVLGRLGGQRQGAITGAIRGGYDAHYGSVELSAGVTSTRGLRPGSVAPSAGLRLRLGVEDGIAVRLAFELLYASGVKVQRAMMRIQGLVLRRFRIYSQLEGLFASGIYSARLGVDVWITGNGDSGSWSLGADVGSAFLRYVGDCELGDCTIPGSSDETFIGAAAHVRLEARL